MARVALPESRLRLRKRRRLLRVVVVFVVCVLLILLGLIGLTYVPALQIKTVSVSGAQTLSSSTIAAFAGERLRGSYWWVLPKSSIFLYPKRTIAESLMGKYPILASADVHAVDFQSIAVLVVERTPRALWCTSTNSVPSTSCLLMDENGVVYADAPIFSEPVYLAYTGVLTKSTLPKQFLTPQEFQSLSALVDAIAQKISDERVESVQVDNVRDVRVRFVSGFTLLFSLDDHGGDVFERLILALTAEPLTKHKLSKFEYLDLRFGDKLYYKLR